MKRTIPIFVFLFSISPSLFAHPPSFQATAVNVAAWNLSGFNGISRQRAAQLANAIAYLDPEVIVLTEVNPDFIAGEIVAELNEFGISYTRSILDQTASLNISILYKHDVQFSNPRLIPGSDDGNSGLRKAFAADIKIGEFDFILIGVHMKSGRGSSRRAVRDRQAEIIANFIQTATVGNEKDVLVVGDYNMIPGEDQSNFDKMSQNGFLNFISATLAGQFSHISASGPGNLLDGYAISQNHTSEYIAESLRIIQMHSILGLSLSDYRDTISDHLPLEALFRITTDDD